MRPAKQGQFDGLCGIYAIVNAIEMTGLTGPRSELHRKLFTRMALDLPTDKLRSAIEYGLEANDLMRVARRSFRWMRHKHEIDLRIMRPYPDTVFDSCDFYLEVLRLWTEEPRTAVIVSVAMPGISHWTVVRRVRQTSMTVRDSGRLTELPLSRFALTRSRYRFEPSDTLIIRRL